MARLERDGVRLTCHKGRDGPRGAVSRGSVVFLPNMNQRSRFGLTGAGVLLIVMAFGLPPESVLLGNLMIVAGIVLVAINGMQKL